MTNRLIRRARTAGLAAVCAVLATMPVQAETTLTTVPSSMTLEAPAPLRFAPVSSVRPTARPFAPRVEKMPDLRWDHIRGSARWTRAAMQALDNHGQRLIDTTPRDIGDWCPAYVDGSEWERKAFWAGLLSTLAKHESTYRPTAVGGGGLWYGLVQILPATARGYGCQARTGDALKDGALNMSCAVRIMNVTVPRDGVVSQGMRGVAADWGPFHSGRKREDMRRWVRSQPFCNGLHTSMRPVERPAWIGANDYALNDWADAPEGEIVPLFVSWELDKQFLSQTPRWPSAVASADEGLAFADTDG